MNASINMWYKYWVVPTYIPLLPLYSNVYAFYSPEHIIIINDPVEPVIDTWDIENQFS